MGAAGSNKTADMNICNQLPSTTCVHVSQPNIVRLFKMSNEPGSFQVDGGWWWGGGKPTYP